MGRKRTGNLNCENCGNVLKMKHQKYPKRFCSKSCSYEYQKGEKHGAWKGGRYTDSFGYVRIYSPNHPNKTQIGYVAEHRLVVEKKLKRYLVKQEIVHHKNGIKHDNRIENLDIKTRGEHTKHHIKDTKNESKRKFEILKELPLPSEKDRIVSLLPNYRTYIVEQCVICNTLFWHRKDYNAKTCNNSCARKYDWRMRNARP